MSELASFVAKMNPDALGETLRGMTFVGEGFGCYENFEVRQDAIPWSEEERRSFIRENLVMLDPNEKNIEFISEVVDEREITFMAAAGEAYTFTEGGLTVDVFWYWDGDGTLAFRVRNGEEVVGFVVSDDCKKDHKWENVPIS